MGEPDVRGADLEVRRLGDCTVVSPLAPAFPEEPADGELFEDERVLLDDTIGGPGGRDETGPAERASFELARPRRRIYFEPGEITAGIVTCGGLCPGLNDVIRGLVQEMRRQYGVRRILGFRHGYQGLTASARDSVVELSGSVVREIDHVGGTFLGTSRGEQDPEEMVDTLVAHEVDVLLVVGGDGTMRGAQGITRVVEERGLAVAVIGVPKTIDNDLPFTDQSFGFHTAVSRAADTINSARAEARSVRHCVSVVELMGRHSGFIACHAALAVGDVDFVLIPEVPFALEGEQALLEEVRSCVSRRGHAVVVVAEGAGMDLLEKEGGDVGGIGAFLTARIEADLDEHGLSPTVRFLDPSYAIRSVPTGTFDSIFCLRLAHAAVHAALAGRTEAVVAQWHGRFVLVPMALMTSVRNQVDPLDDLWVAVLEMTRQPTRLDGTGTRIGS